jgi:hypothetical protein
MLAPPPAGEHGVLSARELVARASPDQNSPQPFNTALTSFGSPPSEHTPHLSSLLQNTLSYPSTSALAVRAVSVSPAEEAIGEVWRTSANLELRAADGGGGNVVSRSDAETEKTEGVRGALGALLGVARAVEGELNMVVVVEL